MEKITTVEQLKTICIAQQEAEKQERVSILVCGGTGCQSSDSQKIVENLRSELAAQGLEDMVEVVRTGCFGFCEKGPIVKILPDNTFYTQVKPEDAKEIVESHIMNNEKVQRLLYLDPKTNEHISDSKHMDFYKKQQRVALRNCGYIDPENIKDYIRQEGYQALAKCITRLTPEEVIEEVKKSGLRGRGGAGFPTGLKWQFARGYQSEQKYVVCNADEGDPGAFMDRSILEGDPHSIVEAMAICGYAIGASEGRVYIRAEYPLAIQRLEKAIESARECGLLGEHILGTDFSFDIQISFGAGAFVCGEETALIHSMEGNRGEPTTKPPFPAESGYWGKPTNVNNVETFANVPVIFLKGADWFSSIGTEKSKGTKVFALAGKINNVGLIEVPMGTTLREVIFDIGGGIKNGKKFKAAQTGGPSGGCLTEKDLDTPIDFDSLVAKGSMMGSGGLIVMDEDDCMPSVARFYLEFTEEESCGKCTPCRVGTKRLSELLKDITQGKGTMEHIAELKRLSQVIKDTALFYIDPEKCKGCTLCARNCPVNAIEGTVRNPHSILQEKCIKCGTCMDKCKFGAIVKK